MDTITEARRVRSLRTQIAEFGQTPRQLFQRPHPARSGAVLPRNPLALVDAANREAEASAAPSAGAAAAVATGAATPASPSRPAPPQGVRLPASASAAEPGGGPDCEPPASPWAGMYADGALLPPTPESCPALTWRSVPLSLPHLAARIEAVAGPAGADRGTAPESESKDAGGTPRSGADATPSETAGSAEARGQFPEGDFVRCHPDGVVGCAVFEGDNAADLHGVSVLSLGRDRSLCRAHLTGDAASPSGEAEVVAGRVFGAAPTAMCGVPNSPTVVLADGEGGLAVVRADDGRIVCRATSGHRGAVLGMACEALRPSTRTAASTTVLATASVDGTVRLHWLRGSSTAEAVAAQLAGRPSLEAHVGRAASAEPSPGAGTKARGAAVAGTGGAAAGGAVFEEHSAAVTAVALQGDCGLMASADAEGIVVWYVVGEDQRTSRAVVLNDSLREPIGERRAGPYQGYTSGVAAMAWMALPRTALPSTAEGSTAHGLKRRRQLARLAIAFSRGWLALADGEGDILARIATGESLSAVVCAGDGRWAATAGSSGRVAVWDVAQAEESARKVQARAMAEASAGEDGAASKKASPSKHSVHMLRAVGLPDEAAAGGGARDGDGGAGRAPLVAPSAVLVRAMVPFPLGCKAGGVSMSSLERGWARRGSTGGSGQDTREGTGARLSRHRTTAASEADSGPLSQGRERASMARHRSTHMQEQDESFDDVLDDLLAEDGTAVPLPSPAEAYSRQADRPLWMLEGLDDDRHGAGTSIAVSASGRLLICATRIGTVSAYGCWQ